MRILTMMLALTLTLLCAVRVGAQAPAANTPDPGVNPVRQIDRAEVRVTRVELQPGAVRSTHAHNDVRFHLFIPVSGKIELTIGSAKPLEATPGQAYFMERGTQHGFKNIGTTPAIVMEVFVKDGAATAQKELTRPEQILAIAGGYPLPAYFLNKTETQNCADRDDACKRN